MIIAHLISNPQFNVWNVSYITSQFVLISSSRLCACDLNFSILLQGSSLEQSNRWERLRHRHTFHALLAVCWRCIELPDQGSATVWPVNLHLVWSQGLRQSHRFWMCSSNTSTTCRGLKCWHWRVLELVENVLSRLRICLLVLALFCEWNLLKFLNLGRLGISACHVSSSHSINRTKECSCMNTLNLEEVQLENFVLATMTCF